MGCIAQWDNDLNFKVKPAIAEYLSKKLETNCNEKIVQFLFKHVAQGLLYLHETMNFANRDIKPENILFTTKEGGTNIYKPDRAQISDFTTIVECKEGELVTDMAGTPAFSAPEINQSQGAGYLPKPADIWSLGLSILCLVSGKLPIEKPEDSYNKDIEIPTNISQGCQDVLRKMLVKDATKRATISELVEMDWLKMS